MTQPTKEAVARVLREATFKTLKDLQVNGKFVDLRLARKAHTCKVCQESIAAHGEYYEITLCGSGLGSRKFPDRVHLRCIDKYLKF